MGFAGLYEVSDAGRVRRVAPGRGTRPGRIVTPRPIKTGYQQVRLFRPGEPPAHLLVSRLVLEAFAGPPPAGHEADHRNHRRGDNRLENLRWRPTSENRRDLACSVCHVAGHTARACRAVRLRSAAAGAAAFLAPLVVVLAMSALAGFEAGVRP